MFNIAIYINTGFWRTREYAFRTHEMVQQAFDMTHTLHLSRVS